VDVGYWFLENADESAAKDKKWTPPEGLLEFIDRAHKNGKKVVYMYVARIFLPVVNEPILMWSGTQRFRFDCGI
jgi:sterol 3beta-glucosyltransferase